MEYNYSYNVLIERFNAFADGHFLIKRFTHGQIDLADLGNDEQYPFMHVTPDSIQPANGSCTFGFHVMFADIPRDKETKAEYQREVLSDCVRLAQDLIGEIKNGLTLFGYDVQMANEPLLEPFMEEYKNTLTGIAFTIQLEVPYNWSACDIPASYSVGGGGGGGGGGQPVGITFRVNGVNNAVQNILDLVAGSGITIVDNGNGSVTFTSTGGMGSGTVTSVALSMPTAFAVGGTPITTAGTLAVTGTGTSNDYIDGTGALQSFPTLATVATTGSYNDLINLPALSSGTVTSVALTTPAAFTVTGSPITANGTLAITGAGIAAQYVDGTGALQTTATALPPNGAAGGDLQGTYPAPTVHKIHGIDMQSGTPTAGDVWLYGGAPAKWQHQQVKTVNSTSLFGVGNIATGTVTSVGLSSATSGVTIASTPVTTSGTITLAIDTATGSQNGLLSAADHTTFNGKQNTIGLTTVGTNLATLPNPSAISYLRVNADNSVTALTATQLKTDLNIRDTFTIRMGIGPISPLDNQTYYFGETALTLSTSPTLYDNKMAFACRVVGANIMVNNNANTATSEASTLSLRINNTTDVLLSNAVVFTGAPPTSTSLVVTGLNQAIAANDEIIIKWQTPNWTTNPTGAQLLLTVFFERT